VGASPPGGVFVLATHDDPRQRHFLKLYKMGDGPLYAFYTPYHICHFEVPLTIARAALFNDAATAPIGAPTVEVVATAKRDLKAGDTIDGIGGFDTYGVCETSAITASEQLLPMGLGEGCVVKRDIPRDQVLTYEDVEVPEGRFADKLRAEQNEYFSVIAGS